MQVRQVQERHHGITAFAEIHLESAPASEVSLSWADGLSVHERIYGDAVRDGVSQALRWHRDLGGEPASFRILQVVELVVDTKEDAVRCAATAAAWKALGHSETELTFDFDGTWRAGWSAPPGA